MARENGEASGLWCECSEARGQFDDVEESNDVGDGLMGEGTCLVGHGRGKMVFGHQAQVSVQGLDALGLNGSVVKWAKGSARAGWARDRIRLNRSVPDLDTWAQGFGHLGIRVWPKENENTLNK